ncbi:MAG: glucose 1-dehydrogenase [Actinobacteria bacterium]|nr:MAG: glucose 1-dehydrogenase [Actinomycetota bacterium]
MSSQQTSGAGRLEHKVALVTGAASGLGAAIAEAYVAEGATVIVADVAVAAGQAVADRLGQSAHYIELDISDEQRWESAVDWIMEKFGRLDVLVNNAAILRLGPLLGFSLNEFRELVDVNQTGTFLGMRTAARVMVPAGRGSIINVASVDALYGTPGTGGYGATKRAVRGLTKVAAGEWGPLGVRCNGIFPGGMDTPMAAPASNNVLMRAKSADEIIGGWPISRLARPAEVAPLAVYLGSDESSYCTGAEFVIDGGATAGPAYLDRTPV